MTNKLIQTLFPQARIIFFNIVSRTLKFLFGRKKLVVFSPQNKGRLIIKLEMCLNHTPTEFGFGSELCGRSPVFNQTKPLSLTSTCFTEQVWIQIRTLDLGPTSKYLLHCTLEPSPLTDCTYTVC